jgi:hypothetical protein
MLTRPQTHELIWNRGQQPLLVEHLHSSSGWGLAIVGHAFQPFCKQALMNTTVTLRILVCTRLCWFRFSTRNRSYAALYASRARPESAPRILCYPFCTQLEGTIIRFLGAAHRRTDRSNVAHTGSIYFTASSSSQKYLDDGSAEACAIC